MESDLAIVFGFTGLKKSSPAFCATEIGEQPVACAPCSLRRGGRTPAQARMALNRKIGRPTSWQLQENGRRFPPNFLHDTWRDWLYWDVELEA